MIFNEWYIALVTVFMLWVWSNKDINNQDIVIKMVDMLSHLIDSAEASMQHNDILLTSLDWKAQMVCDWGAGDFVLILGAGKSYL